MPSSRTALIAAALLLLSSGLALAEKDKKDKKPKVEVSGFLTVYYKFRIDQNGDDRTEPDLFRLGKARIRFKGQLNRYVGYEVEADPRSPTIYGVMRDAFITLQAIPRHVLRFGQQKTPWGYENTESSTRLYTVTRSELAEGLGRGVTLRDIGIGVVGNVKVGKGLRIEDHVTVVNGAGLGVQADDTHRKNVWGRVGVRYKNDGANLVVRAGVSGAIGDQVEFDPDAPEIPPVRFGFTRIGGDVQVDHPWFFAAAEYAMGWDEIPAGSGETESSMAFYLLAAGKTPWKAGPVLRYDAADADEFARFTVGGYWGEPADRVRVLVHYERFEDDLGTHDGRVIAQAQVRF